AEPARQLLHDRARDGRLCAVEAQRRRLAPRGLDRERRPIGDVATGDAHRQALGLEPPSAARRARRRVLHAGDLATHRLAGALAETALEVRDHALEAALVNERRTLLGAELEAHLFVARAVEDELLH